MSVPVCGADMKDPRPVVSVDVTLWAGLCINSDVREAECFQVVERKRPIADVYCHNVVGCSKTRGIIALGRSLVFLSLRHKRQATAGDMIPLFK